ncbi:MAG: MarR family transcriptional regulator [Candidatus Aenigmarchaeota archaeon]|nr:MarR family transcriptional regulator [Candidatus Aenigmarchaeota archaeon]
MQKAQKNIFEKLFLHPKPVKMLTMLKNEDIQYATQVSKVVDCTYSHTVKVLDMFKKLGLVVFEKKGRIKLVKLTDEGMDIAHDFEGIRRKFSKLPGKEKTVTPKK